LAKVINLKERLLSERTGEHQRSNRRLNTAASVFLRKLSAVLTKELREDVELVLEAPEAEEFPKTVAVCATFRMFGQNVSVFLTDELAHELTALVLKQSASAELRPVDEGVLTSLSFLFANTLASHEIFSSQRIYLVRVEPAAPQMFSFADSAAFSIAMSFRSSRYRMLAQLDAGLLARLHSYIRLHVPKRSLRGLITKWELNLNLELSSMLSLFELQAGARIPLEGACELVQANGARAKARIQPGSGAGVLRLQLDI